MGNNEIRKYLNIFNKFFEVSSIVIFSIMLISVVMQVLFRYVLKTPLIWIEEITRFLLIWAVFIGSVVAQKKVVHPRVDFVIDLLPKRLAKKVNIFLDLIVLLFCISMLYYGFQLALVLKNLYTPTLGISLFYLYISIPVTATAMAVNQMGFIREAFRSN